MTCIKLPKGRIRLMVYIIFRGGFFISKDFHLVESHYFAFGRKWIKKIWSGWKSNTECKTAFLLLPFFTRNSTFYPFTHSFLVARNWTFWAVRPATCWWFVGGIPPLRRQPTLVSIAGYQATPFGLSAAN